MANANRSRCLGISLHSIKTHRQKTFPNVVKKFRRREREREERRTENWKEGRKEGREGGREENLVMFC